MCGIIGYVGERDVADVVIRGLSGLEYRGYDSAGIAVLHDDTIDVVKKAGRVSDLEAMLNAHPIHGKLGIGHTRWATHGGVSDVNAHPHRGGDNVVLIHNGIIENWAEIKEELTEYKFVSETDTEAAACLLDKLYLKHAGSESPALSALVELNRLMRGAFALVVIFRDLPDRFYCLRRSSPLVVGCHIDSVTGVGEALCASDATALLPYTADVVYMNEGEIAEISTKGIRFWDVEGVEHKRESTHIDWSYSMVEKGTYPHFMLKEIEEQGAVLRETIGGRIKDNGVDLSAELPWSDDAPKWNRLHIVACGTSYYASLIAERMAEKFAGIDVKVDVASEYRYRDVMCDSNTLAVFVSQSGETADTLAAARLASTMGAHCVAVTNVSGSTLAREVEDVMLLKAGPEIGVAATKTFMGQISALTLLVLWLGKLRGKLSRDDEARICAELPRLPYKVESILSRQNEMRRIAQVYATPERAGAKGFLFIGRGSGFPIAMEGALKLKEIAYVHAEAYAAGEMKHGPIALLDSETPVIAVAPNDGMLEKNASSIQEARARKSPIISIATEGDKIVPSLSEFCFFVPSTEKELYPFLTVLPLQVFAYHYAFLLGRDIDKPRNLAKSVTVE